MMFKRDTTKDEITLAAFIDGTLPPARRADFETSTARDGDVLELLTAARRVMAQDVQPCCGEPPEELVRRVIQMYPAKNGLVRVTLGLAEKLVELLACPADVAIFRPMLCTELRATAEAPISPLLVMAKIFETMQVEMEVENSSPGEGCSIRVAVIPVQASPQENRVRVALESRGRELFSGPLENGRMVFDDVHPGIYSVTIRNNGKVIGEIALKLVAGATGGPCGR